MTKIKSFKSFVKESTDFYRNLGIDTTLPPRSQISIEDFTKRYNGINSFSSIDRIMRTFINVNEINDNDIYSAIYNIIHKHFGFYSKPSVEEIKQFIDNSESIKGILSK